MKKEAVTRIAESLPKASRILRRRDYLHAYENGAKIHGRFVVVFFVANDLGNSRLGVTATRKLGKAVVRNRFKRWVRETYRRNRAATGIGEDTSADFVVNIKAASRDVSFSQFSTDLVKALRRAASSMI